MAPDVPPLPANPPPAGGDRAGGWALAVAGVVVLVLLVVRGYSPETGFRPTAIEPAGVDPNTADAAELEHVPGLGPAKARAVVEHRAAYGPFTSAEQLDAVKGVGPHSVTKAGPFLTIPPPPVPVPDTLERKPPAPAARGAGKIAPGEPPVDVNRASEPELMRLPGVGPTLARRIVLARPFTSVDDLGRVKGVGAKTLDGVRPFVTVGVAVK